MSPGTTTPPAFPPDAEWGPATVIPDPQPSRFRRGLRQIGAGIYWVGQAEARAIAKLPKWMGPAALTIAVVVVAMAVQSDGKAQGRREAFTAMHRVAVDRELASGDSVPATVA